MKTALPFASLCLCLAAGPLFAAWQEPVSSEPSDPIAYEFDVQAAYIGDGDVERGLREINDFDETNTLIRFLVLPSTKVGILRLGAEWERYDFGIPGRARLPDVLQSVSIIVGLDTKFSDSLLFRIEAHPGYFGTDFDDFESEDFNSPFIAGGTYLYSSTLQFVFGVGVDIEGRYPVLPGGGLRWRFAPRWVLNAVLPTPRLEFELNRNMTLYGGLEVRSKTFRVGENFGSARGQPRLDSAVLSYTEVRTGAGFEWKLSDTCRVTAEGGYLPYRTFDYHRADSRYESESGAPYAMVSFHAGF